MTHRDNSQTTYLSDQEERMLAALGDHLFDCSKSAAVREMIKETYARTFGDVKPRELDGPHFDPADVQALVHDELDPSGLDAELRIDESADVALPTDGGAVPDPGSYNALPSPKALEQPGETLSWDELKEIVTDDRRWSDDLVLHPDRVPVFDPDAPGEKNDQKRLRTKPDTASKVLAAVARHETDADGQVHGSEIDALIDEYLLPLHNWSDDDAAQDYFHDQYHDTIGEHLYAHPNPSADLYFVTEDQLEDSVEGSAENTIDAIGDPHPTNDVRSLLDYEEYRDTQNLMHDNRTAMEWKGYVGDWLADVAVLAELQVNYLPHHDTDVDYPDEEYRDLVEFALSLVRGHLEAFTELIPDSTRAEILDHHVDDAHAEIIRDRL